MSRVLRAFHPDVPGPGSRVTLDAEESHHVTRVLRLSPGDALGVFDGKGREWEGLVEEAGRSGAVIRVGAERSNVVEAGLSVELFQALCRPERVEWAIQKATEVGAAAVHPCRTLRSEQPAPSADRMMRWRRLAREACKQCLRRRVPEIHEVAPSAPDPPPGTLALALHPGPSSIPIGRWLRGPRPESVWLLAGPEGGLDAAEVEDLAARGWGIAGLGPRAFRAETAGIVALALVLHAWDDLGRDRAP